MIRREAHHGQLVRLLRQFPVVGLIGARQVGKSTLARALAAESSGGATYLDLEDPRTVARGDLSDGEGHPSGVRVPGLEGRDAL
jgi:uncharacterized protein